MRANVSEAEPEQRCRLYAFGVAGVGSMLWGSQMRALIVAAMLACTLWACASRVIHVPDTPESNACLSDCTNGRTGELDKACVVRCPGAVEVAPKPDPQRPREELSGILARRQMIRDAAAMRRAAQNSAEGGATATGTPSVVATPSTTPVAVEIPTCSERAILGLPDEMGHALDASITLRVDDRIGSGVIVSPDGFAVTAAHVVSDSSKVVVRLRSGTELPATLIRLDKEHDVALLRVLGSRHRCLRLVCDANAEVGRELFAIGSPGGDALSHSVTKGIVSAIRDFNGARYIQTDAALNPGMSGGPLLSRDGTVLGIVSWKVVDVKMEGLAFGVPSSVVCKTLGIALK